MRDHLDVKGHVAAVKAIQFIASCCEYPLKLYLRPRIPLEM